MNAAGERSIAIATICDATFWNSRSVRRGSIFALQDYLLFAMLLTGRPWENRMGNNQGPSKRWFGIRIATNISDRKAITHHCFGLCNNDCWHLGVIFDLIQLLHAASCTSCIDVVVSFFRISRGGKRIQMTYRTLPNPIPSSIQY